MDACSLCYWNFRLCFAIVIFLPGPLFPFLSFSSSRLHLAMVFLSVSLVLGSSPFYYFYLLLSSSLFSFFAIAFPISLHSSLPLPSLTLCLYPTFALLSLGLFLLLLHLLFLIFSLTLLCLFLSPILLCVVFRSLISFNIFSFVILLSSSFSSPELFFLTQFSSSTSLSSFHSDPSSPSFLFLPTNVFLFLSSRFPVVTSPSSASSDASTCLSNTSRLGYHVSGGQWHTLWFLSLYLHPRATKPSSWPLPLLFLLPFASFQDRISLLFVSPPSSKTLSVLLCPLFQGPLPPLLPSPTLPHLPSSQPLTRLLF